MEGESLRDACCQGGDRVDGVGSASLPQEGRRDLGKPSQRGREPIDRPGRRSRGSSLTQKQRCCTRAGQGITSERMRRDNGRTRAVKAAARPGETRRGLHTNVPRQPPRGRGEGRQRGTGYRNPEGPRPRAKNETGGNAGQKSGTKADTGPAESHPMYSGLVNNLSGVSRFSGAPGRPPEGPEYVGKQKA
jgi:hypothetical protein